MKKQNLVHITGLSAIAISTKDHPNIKDLTAQNQLIAKLRNELELSEIKISALKEELDVRFSDVVKLSKLLLTANQAAI